MKKIFNLLMAVLLIASCSLGINTSKTNAEAKERKNTAWKGEQNNPVLPAIPKVEKDKNIIKDYVIVKTKSDFDSSIFEKKNLEICGKLNLVEESYTYWYLHKDDPKLFAIVRSIDGVLNVEYDYRLEEPDAKLVEDKPEGPIQRSLYGGVLNDPIALNADYGLKITGALEAYKDTTNAGYGEKQVVVGIIDTGTNMTHKDLQFTNAEGKDENVVLYAKSCAKNQWGPFVGDGNPHVEIPIGENWDGAGHGTHCSGTICARGNNGIGIAGVAWKNTKLISYQGLGNDGGGSAWAIYGALLDLTNTVEILRKAPATRTQEEKDQLPSYLRDTDFQITQKTVPVNMSLGGPAGFEFPYSVIVNALQHNVLPVIAMGNEGRHTNSFPAAFPGVLSVGATTANDKKVLFSTSGAWISICAPGDGIKSLSNKRNNKYETMSGTSMATPFVTGTIGYLLSFEKAHDLSPYQIKTLLEETADKIEGATGFTEEHGHGRVNVYEAAKKAKAGNVPALNQTYSEGTVRVSVNNKGKTIPPGKITLVDEVTKAPLAYIGASNSNVVEFKGLVKGRTYKVLTSFTGESASTTFTVDGNDQEVVIEFNLDLMWISTVPNKHYNGGNDKIDTAIYVYKIASDGTVDLNAAPVHDYDQDLLDTTCFIKEPNTAYCVIIKAFTDKAGNYRGGNYVIKIGDEALDPNGLDLADGTRTADENDSHEPDNNLTGARIAGNAWNKTYACNLVAGKAPDGSIIEDFDFFVVVPDEPADSLAVPEKPSLVATSDGLKASWKAVPNAKSYLVMLYQDGDFIDFNQTNQLKYVIPGLDSAKKYTVKVKALATFTDFKDSEISLDSDEVNPLPAVQAPTSLQTTVDSTTIKLTWQKPADTTGITGYKIIIFDATTETLAIPPITISDPETANYEQADMPSGKYIINICSTADESHQASEPVWSTLITIP